MNRELEGVLVVALEQAVAAPFCTLRLAEAGARVIKIERPGGDFARCYDRDVLDQSAYFVWLNRGKESIVLDIKDSEDRALLECLLHKADVFIQNLAPGAAARAGFDSVDLRQRHPDLITLDISGYGNNAEYRDMKAYDLLIQCEAGLASITGSEEAPGRVGVSLCDIACGLTAFSEVLKALIARGRDGPDGKNQQRRGLKISLFDTIAEWMNVPLLQHDYGQGAPQRVGLNHPSIAPYGAYSCADGSQVVISIQNEREWRAFCATVLEQSTLSADDRFSDNIRRCENREQLDREINRVFSRLERSELIQRLHTGRIAFGSVNSMAQFSRHPVMHRIEVATENGTVQLAAPPGYTTGGAPGSQQRIAKVPALNEHGAAIRDEFTPSGG